jgi:hypothetical protein
MNRFTLVSQYNLRKTGIIGFAKDKMYVGRKIQTNLKVLQAVKAQHPTMYIDGMDRELKYEKGELGIYTFWYD